tara:strand:+ start:260 stop:547 length:288 start_codon:yes stop_codon:yes gene_type:complete
MAAPIVPRRRIITEKNNLIEIVAWRVPKTEAYPEGIKYSMACIHKNQRIIAFDNFNNEGHHKHYFETKGPYTFESLEATAEKFFMLVEEFEEERK